MKLFLIGGMEDLNFNYCYKITYESGETYDRRKNVEFADRFMNKNGSLRKTLLK